MARRNAGLAEKFLEKRVHGLKAIGVAGIIAQEDVMLQKVNVVFPAVEKNQPVLAKLVIGSEIFAKQGATGFCEYGVFHVIKARLAELQSARRRVLRPGGRQFAQNVAESRRHV